MRRTNVVRVLMILVLVSTFLDSNAATIYSAKAGDWNSDIWSTSSTSTSATVGLRPLTGDDVVINKGSVSFGSSSSFSTPTVHNITINSIRSLTVGALGILNYSGTLLISTNGTLNLDNGGILNGVSFVNNGIASSIGDIRFSGNFTNSPGALFDAVSVTFNGTTTQTINGAVDLTDVTINSGAIVTLSGTATANLNGVLTLVGSATFDADGSGGGVFTVISNDLTTGGRIAALPTPGNFSGNVTVQRFLDGKSGGDYRYISMPVQNGNASFWKAGFGVTGNYTDPSGHADFANIVEAGKTNASVYYWDNIAQAYVPVGSGGSTASTPISSRKGYVAYNFRDAGDDFQVSMVGPIEAGNVPITVSPTADNYNLIPNPYPSPIDWDNVYADNQANIQAAIWWRTGNGTFNSYTSQIGVPPSNPTDGKIAIGQSFWARSMSGTSGTLTMKESHKTLVDATFVRKASPGNYFMFFLASPSQKDYAAIRFVDGATDDEDAAWDARKMRNGNYISSLGQYTYLNLSTYTSSPTSDYAINSVAEVSGCTKSIGIKVADVKPGDYSLGFENLSTMQLPYNMILVDHFTSTEKNIAEGMMYPFSVTTDVKSYGNSRFEIRFETSTTPVITSQNRTFTSSVQTGNQWYKDGQAISDATSAAYKATASGVYTVKTTTGTCVMTSDNLTMTIVSLAEVSGCSKTIGVKVADVVPGNHMLSFDDLSATQAGYDLVLVDNFLNEEKTITGGTSYSFSVTSDPASYDSERFKLQIQNSAVQPVISVQGHILTSSIAQGNQWYKDGQVIDGATNATYETTSSGVYSVKTTTGTCVMTSDNLTMTITGIPELRDQLIVYPNPAQGLITINLPQEMDASLTGINIYDPQGKSMISSDIDASLLKPGAKVLDVSGFRAGVYILNIVCGSEVKSIRLIKK